MSKKRKNSSNPIAPSKSLDAAAAEWVEDPIKSSETVVPENRETTEKPFVTFVSDPAHLSDILDTANAQKNEEIDFDGVDDSLDEKTEPELATSAFKDEEAPDATNDEANETNTEALTGEENEDEFDDDNEMDLDSPQLDSAEVEQEVSATLEKLKTALAEQEAKSTEEAELDAKHMEEDATKLLASQIAEDEALEKALKEESQEEIEQDPELLAALPKTPVSDENGNLDLAEMESCIEAMLFIVDKPISAVKLRELLGPEMPLGFFQEALTSLKDRYRKLSHGIEIVEVAGGYQFRTKPARAALAKKLAKVSTHRLSTGGMETLAIIAYKQPCLKDDVDKVRGVDSSHFIRGLLDKKLIHISGRSDLPGRPMLYETTKEFLEVFGLKDLNALPSLREIEQMVPSSQTKNPDDEDPRVKEMRRLVGEMKADHSTSLIYDPKEDEKFLSEIKERVGGIAVSTPSLDEQRAAEKQAAEAMTQGFVEDSGEAQQDLKPAPDPQ